MRDGVARIGPRCYARLHNLSERGAHRTRALPSALPSLASPIRADPLKSRSHPIRTRIASQVTQDTSHAPRQSVPSSSHPLDASLDRIYRAAHRIMWHTQYVTRTPPRPSPLSLSLLSQFSLISGLARRRAPAATITSHQLLCCWRMRRSTSHSVKTASLSSSHAFTSSIIVAVCTSLSKVP